MTKLKMMLGLCAVLALAICAFGAQGASATGVTAFTCAPVAADAKFKDAHCKEAGSNPGGSGFIHQEIAPGVDTEFEFTNETTGGVFSTAKLKSVQSGVTLELQATGVHGEGTLTNMTEGANMYVTLSGVIRYTNVTITAPAGKGCKVAGGEIVTNPVMGSTKGLTNQLELAPEGANPFATFTIEGCSVAALNHAYTAGGSVKGTTNGATIEFTHAGTTAQKTLTLFGQNAGLEGSVTLKMKGGNGIAFTATP